MAFNLPQRTSIGAQTPVSPAVWVRPSDWISITGASPGEVVFLVSDVVSAKYNIDITETGVGNVYINWGDGTTTTISSDSVVSKTYTSGGTPCSLGYNTWKITITSDPGVRITGAKLVFGSDYSGTPYGLLEAWYGNNTIITAENLFSNNNIILPYLEYVKLPEGMTEALSLYRSIFSVASIKKIDLPISLSACTTMEQFAQGCTNLIEINDLPKDMTGLTTLLQAFNDCRSIQKLVLPPVLNSLTIINSFANNCVSVTTIVLPTSMTACTDYISFVNNCNSLLSLTIPRLTPTGTLVFILGGCTNLRNITFPNDTPSTLTLSLGSAFNECRNLQSVILPPNVKVSSYAATFFNCSSLKSVSLPMDASSVTSMFNMFNGCSALTSVTLPTIAPSAPVNMDSAFNSCVSLSEIVIPSTYLIATMSQTFSGARNLKSVTLPNNAQNSLGNLTNTFQNCSKLQSVVLPTSLNAITSVASMFNGCSSLSGVTFPSSMPALNSFSSCFNACSNLQTVVLPTSINGNAGVLFGNMFTNCFKIKNVVLPATLTSPTIPNSFGSTFQNCYTLKSVTLPTSNLTNISGGISMFSGCRSLTGVTNMTSLGSSSPTGIVLNGTGFATDARMLDSISFVCRISKLELNGTVGTGNQSNLRILRLLNTGTGQWGGTTPQIDVSYTSLSTAALNTLFADMAAQGNVTGKTINITGALGAAGLTPADRLVITSRGWTITG